MEKPAEKENGEPAKQVTDSSLLASSAKGASSLILLQLVSRMLTFTLNQMALKFISAETLGVASIKLELLLSTILFISREGFRTALLRGGNDCSDADKNEQKITNLAYIPTAIGLVTTILTCGYYISMIDPVSNVYPWYKTSIILYGLSAFLELLVEPLFTRALNGLNFQLRVNIEGVAVLLRCILTFALTVYGNDPKTGTNRFGVLAFAIAQFVFGLTMMTGYASYYLYKVKLGQIPSVKQLLPQPIEEKENVYWFDKKLLNLGMTMTKQSLLKHVLTEGDKMLISALSNDADQGIYAFVVNYGSLVARILFQPLEETSRTLFSKLLADNESGDNSDNNRNNRRIAVDTLLLFLRFHVLLGMIFIFFATNYTATLIDLIAGKTWSVERNTPSVLAVYCVYVPIMGINGITEAFVQAVATKSDLGRLSYYMFTFSVAFMIAGVVFMQLLQLGGIGLILANMVNLGIRIAYSWYFIRHYFKGDSSVTVSRWFPHRLTVSAFILAWCVTRWSEVNVGFHTLRQKIIHIGIGAVCFGLVSIVIYCKERALIAEVKNLVKPKKT